MHPSIPSPSVDDEQRGWFQFLCLILALYS
jgi:hypothetical protein